MSDHCDACGVLLGAERSVKLYRAMRGYVDVHENCARRMGYELPPPPHVPENPRRATIQLPDPIKREVRALRLWHWQQFKSENSDVLSGRSHFKGTFHMRQVQLLNCFFDLDDTAEGDDQ